MVPVTAGSDTYGSVKKVGNTRVVTKFVMLNAVPLYPLESFYCLDAGQTTSTGVPFVFSLQNTSIIGLPLARIDRLSVVMTYVRGLCGLLVVFGSVVIAPIVMHLTGAHLDDFAIVATVVLACIFLIGCIGGAISYLLPPGVSEREESIRLCCGRLLGIEADPAAIRSDVARELVQWCREVAEWATEEVDPSPGDTLVRKLIMARLKIAIDGPSEVHEARTDRLLERLTAITPRSDWEQS